LRTIELVAWQRAIIDEQRKQFVRGLIHSDGCRIVANDRGSTVTALPLLEPVGRHQAPVLRVPRRARSAMDQAMRPPDRRLPQGFGRDSGHVHRPEVLNSGF
jgi:hypothetical protein